MGSACPEACFLVSLVYFKAFIMVFRIAHEFLDIGKESLGFSKNYFYEWEDGLGGPGSQLFLNFRIDSTEVPGNEIGNAIFEVMKNYFFHGLDRAAGDRFEDMLKEVNAEVRKREEDLGVKFVPNMHVLAAAVWDGELYLSQHGESEAYLVRRRFVSTISEGLSDSKNKDELFSNISSGEIADGDYLLLCSSRLVRYITKSDLGKLISEEPSLKVALSAVNDAVSLDLMDRMSILGVHVKQDQEAEAVIEGEKESAVKSGPGLMSTLKLHLGKLIPEKVVKEQPKEELAEHSEEVSAKAKEVLGVADVVEEVRREQGISQKGKVLTDFADLIQEWKQLKRDKILLALIAVVVILLVGIYMVRHQGQKQQLVAELEANLETVELNINTAQTTGSYDKESATILLDEAEELALEVLNSGYLRGKASEYLGEIEVQRDYLDNVTRVENPTVFVDFAATNPGMKALGIVPFKDRYYVYEYNQLHEIVLGDVQDTFTIDPDEVVIDAAYFEDDESILFLTKANRIIEFKDDQFSFVDTDDGSWHAAVDLEIYNSRIYLLDPSQSQIWRYYQQRSGYSGADGYVTDGTDLSTALSLAIDGSIYTLHDDGGLTKLLSGENSEYSIKNAPTTDLSGVAAVYTEFEMFQVFILDAAGSRVLIFNKDSRTGNLVYDSQYVLDTEDSLKSIYVDKEIGRLYVVSDTKVYEVTY